MCYCLILRGEGAWVLVLRLLVSAIVFTSVSNEHLEEDFQMANDAVADEKEGGHSITATAE